MDKLADIQAGRRIYNVHVEVQAYGLGLGLGLGLVYRHFAYDSAITSNHNYANFLVRLTGIDAVRFYRLSDDQPRDVPYA